MRPDLRSLGPRIGFADHLPHLQAAAGHAARSRRRPNARGRGRGSSTFGVRPNSPSTTTSTSSVRPRSSRSVTSAADALIEHRQHVAVRFEDVLGRAAVMVPRADLQRHHPHARLHQPPGEHERLGVPVVQDVLVGLVRVLAAAVPLERLRRLAAEIERLADRRRRDHLQRLGLEPVEPLAASLVELSLQG